MNGLENYVGTKISYPVPHHTKSAVVDLPIRLEGPMLARWNVNKVSWSLLDSLPTNFFVLHPIRLT